MQYIHAAGDSENCESNQRQRESYIHVHRLNRSKWQWASCKLVRQSQKADCKGRENKQTKETLVSRTGRKKGKNDLVEQFLNT